MFEFSIIPARVTNYTAAAIDNIIINSIFDNDSESAIIKTDVSDHFPKFLKKQTDTLPQKTLKSTSMLKI